MRDQFQGARFHLKFRLERVVTGVAKNWRYKKADQQNCAATFCEHGGLSLMNRIGLGKLRLKSNILTPLKI